MKGLSNDIEEAVKIVIQGLEYPIDASEVDPDKLTTVIQSKTDSFIEGKKLILDWQQSENAPSHTKLKKYLRRLVEAGDSSMSVLRMSLREEIDYDNLAPEKHKKAIASKTIILKGIRTMDNGLIELRNQIESDKINLKENEFKRGYPEKFANGEFYPESDYYKNWLDEDNDAVLICPKGTKGETIVLDGLNVTLPKKPMKKHILFSDLKKKEQYWRRLDVPPGLNPDSVDSYTNYILEEFRRRREGIWFMNNGKAEYLTGSHYFALQWFKMEDNGGYMNFRYAQRDMFYFTRACIVDKRCLGELFVKSRRTGFTYQILVEMANDATSTSNARLGMTSKSDDDAKKAFSKFSYGFLNLPFYFQPVVKGAADSKNQLEFAKPSDRSKAGKKKKDTSTDGYMNTLIDYLPTKDDAYDGQKMYRYLGDEASKWRKPANYEKHWGQIAPTFDEGGMVVGKAFIGSTVAAMKSGGAEFKRMYQASQVHKRNKITGRTPSGLYSYFLPAHKNMSEFTDKYGVCHEILEKNETFYNVNGIKKTIGSITFLEAKRKSKRKESDIAYNEELRAFPMKVSEAFRDELKTALFNTERIISQIDFNEDTMAEQGVSIGNFSWENGVQDSKVVWNPNPDGRFHISWLPPKELQNKHETRLGHGGYSKYPLNDDLGAFGCDSYDISGTVEGVRNDGSYNHETSRASKAALHGLTSFTFSNAPSNHFFLEYVARPKTAEIMFEDVLMACIFYGMPILAENNKPRLLYHFKNRGYRGFSITRFDKAANRLSPTEKELGGMPNSSEDIKQIHAGAIESYIDKYVGYDAETGECGSMPFNRTLDDWKHFDISNRTKYDASISSGLAIMAVNRNLYKPKYNVKNIQVNIKTYKH